MARRAGRDRATTIDSYRRAITAYVLARDIAAAQLQTVEPEDLNRLYADLLTAGSRSGGALSMRTVRYLHSIISKAFSDAERNKRLARNPARLASPPKTLATRAPEFAVWTPKELATFLAANTEHHHATLFRLAAMSGMRRGELCGVRWDDVDLDAGLVRVRRTITTVNHKPVEGDVNTKRSRRTLDLDATTVAALRAHRKAQLEQRMLMGAGFTDGGLKFSMPDGRPWNPDTITQAFDRLVRASKLPRIRLHDLRHSHATHLLAAGVNVKVVSERLGHASVAFTLDR